MRQLTYVLLTVVTFFSLGCSKNETPTQPSSQPSQPTTYTSADIKGTWEGDAVKSSVTTHFLLTCNDTLGLSGTAVNTSGTLTISGKWQIDSTGYVNYGGYHVYHWINGVTTIAWGAWYVGLNTQKNAISGYFDLPAIAAFDSAAITLAKK
jgi:hypothetical protein